MTFRRAMGPWPCTGPITLDEASRHLTTAEQRLRAALMQGSKVSTERVADLMLLRNAWDECVERLRR